MLRVKGHRFITIGGLGHHQHALLEMQHRGKPGTHHMMIVRNEQADGS
jgi:hypothetical protein